MEEGDREWPGLGRREEVRIIPKGRAKADSVFKGTRLTREELGEGRRLPEGPRTIFVLHDVERYRHEEIAEIFGITVGMSKAQLRGARLLVRETLAR